jgi:hypothetical protein
LGHVLKLLNWTALLFLLLAGATPAHADIGHGAEVSHAVEADSRASAHLEAPVAPSEPAVHCGTPMLGLVTPTALQCPRSAVLVYQPADGWQALAKPPGFDPPPPRSPLTT